MCLALGRGSLASCIRRRCVLAALVDNWTLFLRRGTTTTTTRNGFTLRPSRHAFSWTSPLSYYHYTSYQLPVTRYQQPSCTITTFTLSPVSFRYNTPSCPCYPAIVIKYE